VPSNVLLARFGGPMWLSRIMISWGLVASCGVALRSAAGFYASRIALGAAEAGFYPGMAFYLSSWFTGDEFGAKPGCHNAFRMCCAH
jgi:MFS family permease